MANKKKSGAADQSKRKPASKQKGSEHQTNYAAEPFFVKKAEAASSFLNKVGLPKVSVGK